MLIAFSTVVPKLGAAVRKGALVVSQEVPNIFVNLFAAKELQITPMISDFFVNFISDYDSSN
jgi:hypothetical protein